MTPLKAIREKCLDCCCGASAEVKLCPVTGCALWQYRFGHNPNVALSDEERERRSERARKMMTELNAKRGAK